MANQEQGINYCYEGARLQNAVYQAKQQNPSARAEVQRVEIGIEQMARAYVA